MHSEASAEETSSLRRPNMIAHMDPAVIVPTFCFPVLTLCPNSFLHKLNYPIVILFVMSETLKYIALYHPIVSLLLATEI